MFIPLNLKERQDLGLSVLRLKKGHSITYSVAIIAVVNGYGMDELPSYMHHIDDKENLIVACACTTDYEIIEGPDLYDCINKCLEQLGA